MNLFVLKTWLQTKFARDEDGGSLVEYVLLLAFIAVAVIGAVIFMRNGLVERFNYAGSQVSNAPGTP